MVRYALIAVSLLFVGSIFGQSLSTTTDYPSTSTSGTVLTAFAFEMYSDYILGDVDNIVIGDANGNVHVSVSGTWELIDLLSGNDNPITTVSSSFWPEEPFVGTSSGIFTSFTYNLQDRNDVPDDERRPDALAYLSDMINANITKIESGDEGVWAATLNDGLYNFGEEDLEVHFTMDNSPLTTNNIASIGLTSTDHVVIAHGSTISLFRYKQGNTLPWENHDLAASYCDDIQTQYVYVGSSDDIYVTTNRGVFNYDGTKFNKVPEFGNRDYSQIISTPNGEVWAFEEGVGFHILKGGEVGFIPADNINVPSKIYDIKYDKGTIKFLSDLNHGITSASYVSGTSDSDGDGVSYTLDGDDGDENVLAAAVEICDDGIDNDCDGEIDEECPENPEPPAPEGQLLVLQPDSGAGQDAFVNSLEPNVNKGGHADIIASAWTNGGSNLIARSFLNFDLSLLPEGAEIVGATLSLYGHPSTSNSGHSTLSGSNEGIIERVSSEWTESGVTWNNQPTVTNQNSVGIDASTSDNQHYENINITALISDILLEGEQNFGFRISLLNEVKYRSLLFASSDHSDPNLRPKLVIEYNLPEMPETTSFDGQDAFVTSLEPDVNKGGHADIVASAWTNGGSNLTTRILLKFDLSSIPDGAEIVGATLSLYGHPSTSNSGHSTLSGSNEGIIERVTSEWTESGVTWNNQPTVTNQNSVGIDASTSDNQHYENIDITAIVSDIMVEEGQNFGFRISLVNEVKYRSLLFASSDHSDPNLRPKLVIEYNMVTDTSELTIGQPHPTLGGFIFYLNGSGGGLIVDEEDLINSDFDNLSMFRWADPEHLRTETGVEYFNFNDWSQTSAHNDQKIIDAYGNDGNYAAIAIRHQLGAEWRLPTATEAYYMDLNLNQGGLGNFADGHYWTSSEVIFTEADIAPSNVVAIDMSNGEVTTKMAKIQALKVRAVRSF